MTKFDYYRCDECGKELEPAECSSNQLMFELNACYDTSVHLGYSNVGNKAHLCGVKCLIEYVKKLKDHEDLPTIGRKNGTI